MKIHSAQVPLTPGPNDAADEKQRYLRSKLEQNLQRYLDTLLQSCSPNASGIVLTEFIKCWLHGASGRNVRFVRLPAGIVPSPTA